MDNVDLRSLGAALRRRRRRHLRNHASGDPMSPEDIRKRIGARSSETIRRLEAGSQFPPLKRLVKQVLPAYGLTLREWVALASAQAAERGLGVLRQEPGTDGEPLVHLPAETRAADDAIVVRSFGKGVIDNQEMGVTWIELQAGIRTGTFEHQHGETGHRHEGEEVLLVVSGHVEFMVALPDHGQRRYTLHAGDGVILKADNEHYVHNPGDEPARYVVIRSPALPARAMAV